jgi:rSAM/selenodomain-associated transferase 2
MNALSVIVPTLNESAGIVATLATLQPLRRRGVEIIVADGGSTDDTRAFAAPFADAVITASRGRARQMNAGAAHACGGVLLFLHADTCLPDGADRLVEQAMTAEENVWGRFDVSIAGTSVLLRVVAWFMNRRSRLTGVATGDQAMFVRTSVFRAIGGFADIALMEDIELSGRLKRCGWPVCLEQRVVTSGRRWERSGVLRTMLLMWRLRVAYLLGAEPARLAVRYDDASGER